MYDTSEKWLLTISYLPKVPRYDYVQMLSFSDLILTQNEGISNGFCGADVFASGTHKSLKKSANNPTARHDSGNSAKMS